MPEEVVKKTERWSSDSCLVYVRANMEDPVQVSEVLDHGGGVGETARTGD